VAAGCQLEVDFQKHFHDHSSVGTREFAMRARFNLIIQSIFPFGRVTAVRAQHPVKLFIFSTNIAAPTAGAYLISTLDVHLK
jgi:hypothetical protein